MEVKKSKRAAIESQRGTWLLVGFVVVLAFMFVTFEWTQHDIKVATARSPMNPFSLRHFSLLRILKRSWNRLHHPL